MQIHITLDREDFTRSMNGPDAVAEALALLATAVHGRLPMEEPEPNLGTVEADPVAAAIVRTVTEPAAEQQTETPAPKKRGRKSLADKMAEREPAMSEPEPEAETDTVADDNQPDLPFDAPADAEPVVEAQPEVPAMPEETAVVETGDMTLDDLKAIMLAVNQKRPGATFPVLRKNAWSDGSEKPSWLTAEAVPAEMRARLAADMKAAVGLN